MRYTQCGRETDLNLSIIPPPHPPTSRLATVNPATPFPPPNGQQKDGQSFRYLV